MKTQQANTYRIQQNDAEGKFIPTNNSLKKKKNLRLKILTLFKELKKKNKPNQ